MTDGRNIRLAHRENIQPTPRQYIQATKNTFRSIPGSAFEKGSLIAPFFQLGGDEIRLSDYAKLLVARRDLDGVTSFWQKMVLGRQAYGLMLPGIKGDNDHDKYVLSSGLVVTELGSASIELAIHPSFAWNEAKEARWQRTMEQWQTPPEGEKDLIIARYFGKTLCDLADFNPKGTFESVSILARGYNLPHGEVQ